MRFSTELIRQQLIQACVQRGMAPDHAAHVAEILVEAELEGLGSHGLSRFPTFVAQLDAGSLNAAPEIRCERSRPAVVLLDGDRGPGPVAAMEAVRRAAALAREAGIGMVAVRRAGHVGPLSSYVKRLAQAGLCGLAVANTPPAMAPWNGHRVVLGTNPIAFAAPVDPDPLVVDLALSVTARGKILRAAREGQPIPEDWAVDAEGRPTRDPHAALKGALLPAGGAKGYALAVMVEVLAGALAGGILSADLPRPWESPGEPSLPGFLLLALDTGPFDRGDALIRDLVGSIEAAGGRVPGTRRARMRAERERDGVPIAPDLQMELARLGMPLSAASVAWPIA
jgi:(2R)-3-sulfolactate dehydrogenase (NADP+)